MSLTSFFVSGEIGAPFTAKLLQELVSQERVDVINHIGDISYATGQLSLWDSFLYEVESVASEVPWMTGIGNHEMGWAESDLPGGDSQGECGVPYISLFPFSQRSPWSTVKDWKAEAASVKLVDHFPMNAFQTLRGEKQVEPYYGYALKNVYVVMISTEHSLVPGSPQLLWLEEELKRAKQMVEDKTSSVAWILLLGHRPMYISTKYLDPSTRHLRRYVEPLMSQYAVDIAMWGHHHSYQRFKCKIYNAACDSDRGVAQIVSGAAGFEHTRLSKETGINDLFKVRDDKNWGVNVLQFKNKTHCRVRFVENKGGKTLDEFWVDKNKGALE